MTEIKIVSNPYEDTVVYNSFSLTGNMPSEATSSSSVTTYSGGIVGEAVGTVAGCFYAPISQTLTNTNANYGTQVTNLASSLNNVTAFTTTNIFAWDSNCAWDFSSTWMIGHITKNSTNYKLPTLKEFSYIMTLELDDSTSIEEGVLYGSDFIFATPSDLDFENDGYNFINWTDTNSNQYNAGDTLTPTSDLTFTANWQASERTITLTCTNFENQSFCINIYKDGVLQNQYVGQGTLTLVLSQGDYTFQYVFTYIGKLEIASNSNVQIFDRKVNLINFVDTTIYYTISTPKINSAIVI